MNNNNVLVLVTGGSGFVGAHCVLQLLQQGFRVRTTVRSEKKIPGIINVLKPVVGDAINKLSFTVADLTNDIGWAEAVNGCTYVLHVASPFLIAAPKDENELIIPAVQGSLRVLKASKKAGVKRVVLTSSFAAVGYTAKNSAEAFNENDWTNPNDKNLSAYIKSKALAEKAAWDYIKNDGKGLELAVINPVGIFGPLLNDDLSASVSLIQNMLTGKIPAVPNISFSVVDVRDVALLHIKAMTNEKAAGQRFLAVSGEAMTFPDIAKLIKNNFGNEAQKVPSKILPNFVVKVGALFSSQFKEIAPLLGKKQLISNQKAKTILNWQPISNEEAILASAKSLIQLNKSHVTSK